MAAQKKCDLKYGLPNSETTSRYLEYVRARVDEERWVHCVETAKMAAELAARNGESPARAAIAGLVHDVARPMSDEELIARSGTEDDISEVERRFPKLLHGPVAAKMVRDEMKCTDEELLFAVRHHTCGHPQFATLGKCLMVADYIEPSRDFPEAAAVRAELTLDIDRILLRVIESKINYLQDSGLDVAPRTVALRHILQQRISRQ